MQDGRSARFIPARFYWLWFCEQVNARLGTAYTVQQLKEMDTEEHIALELWVTSGR